MIDQLFEISGWTALIAVLISMLLTLIRLYRGPNLMDRILALDLLMLLGIALIGAISAVTAVYVYIDIAVALALVGFLGTVSFAYYALRRYCLAQDKTSLEVD